MREQAFTNLYCATGSLGALIWVIVLTAFPSPNSALVVIIGVLMLLAHAKSIGDITLVREGNSPPKKGR